MRVRSRGWRLGALRAAAALSLPPRPRSPAPCAAASVGPARASPRRCRGHRPRSGRHLCFCSVLLPPPPPPPPGSLSHVTREDQWMLRLGLAGAAGRANEHARARPCGAGRRGAGPRETRGGRTWGRGGSRPRVGWVQGTAHAAGHPGLSHLGVSAPLARNARADVDSVWLTGWINPAATPRPPEREQMCVHRAQARDWRKEHSRRKSDPLRCPIWFPNPAWGAEEGPQRKARTCLAQAGGQAGRDPGSPARECAFLGTAAVQTSFVATPASSLHGHCPEAHLPGYSQLHHVPGGQAPRIVSSQSRCQQARVGTVLDCFQCIPFLCSGIRLLT